MSELASAHLAAQLKYGEGYARIGLCNGGPCHGKLFVGLTDVVELREHSGAYKWNKMTGRCFWVWFPFA